jgi:hypothetical protein
MEKWRGTVLLGAIGLGLGLASPGGATIFDDLEVGPRARGLGGCYAGLSGDATGIYYNPAGLVNVESLDIYASAFEPFNYGFHRVNLITIAYPTGTWGTIGLGYHDYRVDYERAVLMIERTFSLAHGIELMKDLSSALTFGYAVNVYNLDFPTPTVGDIDLGSESTIGIDVGFQARLRDRTTAGVFFENVNNPTLGDPVETELPQRISGGMAYRPYDGVITAVEVEKQIGQEVQFHGGIEFQVASPLVLRFGAQSEPNLFDVGAGLLLPKVNVDFTYTHHPVLDGTFHYGLGLRF